ncbi:hypothetical protein PSQ19_06045 [Devosia algicola]|uniref:Scaffolding protein n=1 Tax=Devosia algicola TaxID=3026418 RepID=A0ABY7YQM1_9HYPH|nr:hypothetical protein [Devosia algicola]WDR03629.1 hypothetical protein PSQ19_06045 [Devosia algicola]
MSSVEALEQEQPTTEAPIEAAPVTEQVSEAVSLDDELDGIWDRANVTNGANRGENGKFVSPKGAEAEQTPEADEQTDAASLEGETGEDQQDGSTPVDVPLPANRLLNSMDAEWATLTPELQQKLTERSNELHTKLSEQGALVSKFKPLSEAAGEFAEYFNGNLKDANGEPISQADGIRYLAGIQRAMDTNPLETLMSIADTYGLREQLAATFGGEVKSVPADQQQLLNEIAGLKQTVARLQDPATFEGVLEQRDLKSEISRFASSKPHYAQVEADLPFFINKAKTQLGEGAARTAILEKAYDLAVQADPALRAQTQQAAPAAKGNAAKAEAAKRANGVNVTSTSTGKAKQPSLDDELGAVWDKHKRA